MPSNLPLQGGKGFSRSLSELSSSGGVWLVRKGEKMRKVKEKEKKWELLKGSRLNVLMSQKESSLYSACLGLL